MKNRNKSVLKMAPPWIQYVNKITALFGRDPEVLIDYDNDEVELKLRVTNPRKADALIQLLPPTREFGGVQLKITVIPANLKSTEASLFKDAFYGNPAVSDFVTKSTEQTITGTKTIASSMYFKDGTSPSNFTNIEINGRDIDGTITLLKLDEDKYIVLENSNDLGNQI